MAVRKNLYTVLAVVVAAALAASLLTLKLATPAKAATALPSGFQESIVFSGLNQPTNVEFSKKDGRVFVAEKSGLIKVFDSLSDPTPTIFADLRTKVHNFWDRGLLGLALDPDFPTKPYVYVLYTRDAPIGGTAPRWGSPGATSDTCPTPPGATADGCVVSGRLSRLQADGNVMTGTERVLIDGWCQQYPGHSIGDLGFGGGALYVSGGDGASFNFADYGQGGGSAGSPTPKNPCGDPPSGVGGTQTPPTAEGGALRSQDLRTTGDPVALNGAILRVDPATGATLPNNPLYSSIDPNARRIIADGLRTPFRFAIRPGTGEIWIGNVGWNSWEEINRISSPTDAVVENFGWPCYEGTGRQAGYDAANLNICENLYRATNAVKAPYFAYNRSTQVVAGETCPTGSSSIAGLAFYAGGPYPDRYDGSLFFADYSRKCIWAMFKGSNGLPDPATRQTFVSGAANPIDLAIGPGGDLFYVDLGGTIRRIEYTSGNRPPTARATASPTYGPTPLTVAFDGTGSTDPNVGDTLTYAWDLDGDGAFDDSTSPQPRYTYDAAGNYDVQLQVTDSHGLSDKLDEPITVSPGNTPPTATVTSPSAATTWKVGDTVSFSGSATDPEDGALPASALSWSLILHHCSLGSCHEHPLQEFSGVASGSFVAPDHEYEKPTHLELRLTAEDAGGLQDTKSVQLDPQTVVLSFQSSPSGLGLVVGSDGATAPFSRTVIVGSKNFVSAPSPQTLAGKVYRFASWSDGGAQTHEVVPRAQSSTYTAVYKENTAPTITNLSPAPGSTVADRTPTISATVRDDWTDLRKLDISLYLDGRFIDRANFTYDRATDRLTYTPGSNLVLGWHTVKIDAVDENKATGTRSWSFQIVDG